MKLHSKIISRNADKERLPEVASLITVAIWRLHFREKEKISKNLWTSVRNGALLLLVTKSGDK